MRAPELLEPRELAELEEAVADIHARGDEVRLVAGGTLEVPRWRSAGAPPVVVYLPALRDLQTTGRAGCGAARTLAQIAFDDNMPPLLREIAAGCASPAVRTMATLGGNIAACRPGCLAVALLALDARLAVAEFGRGLRVVPLDGVCPLPADGSLRVITHVEWLNVPRYFDTQRLRLQTRSGPSATIAAVAADISGSDVRWRVAVGGTNIAPQRLTAIEDLLVAEPQEVRTLRDGVPDLFVAADQNDVTDHQRHVAAVIVKRAIRETLDQISDGAGK